MKANKLSFNNFNNFQQNSSWKILDRNAIKMHIYNKGLIHDQSIPVVFDAKKAEYFSGIEIFISWYKYKKRLSTPL